MAATAEPGPDPAIAISHGLAVFPLPPDGRRPASGWQQRCSRDPAALDRWWQPGDNIGVGCRASRVVVLDLDRHPGAPDGITTFAALCAAHGQPWPHTLTVATPNDGLHLYFRAPVGATIGSTSGGRSPLGPGIDIRGPGRRSGGYVVGPGSIVHGKAYVIERDAEVDQLPTWLTRLLVSGD